MIQLLNDVTKSGALKTLLTLLFCKAPRFSSLASGEILFGVSRDLYPNTCNVHACENSELERIGLDFFGKFFKLVGN